MPNWCSNTIRIDGPRAKIEALYQEIKGKNQMLNVMVPRPESLDITSGYVGADDSPEQIELVKKQEANLKEHGHKDWYSWSVANWGTKWDIDTEGLELNHQVAGSDNAEINGWFESAWSPPIEAIETYAEKNPDVNIYLSYNEPGMCFVGSLTCEGGESFGEDTVDYSDATHKTVRQVIGEQYDDEWNISENMAEWAEEEEAIDG